MYGPLRGSFSASRSRAYCEVPFLTTSSGAHIPIRKVSTFPSIWVIQPLYGKSNSVEVESKLTGDRLLASIGHETLLNCEFKQR